jgi:hypothetical protein
MENHLADIHNISNMQMNYYSQVLNVHSITDVRQTEIHAAEQLVEIAIAKLKKYKSSGSN